MAAELFGRLIIVGREGHADIEFPIDKRSVLIGRDHSCDIRIVNKEISRKHAEVYVEDGGAVYITSMGREPITVNGKPVESPLELQTGDKIEVHLEARTRVFYFQGDDETVQIVAPGRQPLNVLNTAAVPASRDATPSKPAAPAGQQGPAPPPSPPPMPVGGIKAAAAAPRAPPVPARLPAQPAAAAPAVPAGGMPAALKEAIQAGVQLRKVKAEERSEPPRQTSGPFVPNPADLLKLKASLRKTGDGSSAEPAATAAPADQVAALTSDEPVAEQPKPEAEHTAAQAVAEDMDTDGAEEGAAGEAAHPVESMAVDVPAAADAAVREPAPAPTPVVEAAAEPEEQAEQPAAEAQLVPVEEQGQGAGEKEASALKARKSVRFNVEQQQHALGTPEGAAHDATITIRLRRGDIEQIINVDDNTVAFAQWGLGTMGADDACAELPDTVVSKRSRPSVPASTGKTVTPAAMLFGADSTGKQATPLPGRGAQATPGAAPLQAPAPTPITAAKPRADGSLTVDPTTLAAKLAEMAEQHDVTLEVPASFFQQPEQQPAGQTPGKTSREGFKLVLTPKSMAKSPAAQQAAMPGSVARSVPRTGPSRLAQAGAAESEGHDKVEATQEVVVPEEVFAAAAGQATGSKTPVAAAAAELGSTRKSVRRSGSRTPGTKVVIIERTTQTTPRMGLTSAQTLMRGAGTGAGTQTTPRLLSTIGMQTESSEESEEGVEQCQPVRAESLEAQETASGEGVSLMEYQRAILRARAYRTEAQELAKQLHKANARAAKLKRAAQALGCALEEERAKRRELQAAVQQVVANRDAVEAELDEAEGMELEGQGAAAEEGLAAAAAPAVQARVVVVRPAGQPATRPASTVEYAGSVVVVRPPPAALPAAPAPTPGPAVPPASACKTSVVVVSALKKAATPAHVPAEGQPGAAAAATRTTPATRGKTAKKTPGTQGRVVLDDVELPQWVFEEVQAPAQQEKQAAVATDMAAVIAEETQDKEVMAEAQDAGQKAKEEVEAGEDEGDRDEEDDVCHVCGESDEGDVLLLCDSCDNACHPSCCQPPLKRVPKGDWFCVECTVSKQAEEQNTKPAAKRGSKKESEAGTPGAEAQEASKPTHGRRAAAAAAAETAPAEEPAAKLARGAKRGRGASAPEEQAQEAAKAPAGRGKRAKKEEQAPAQQGSERAATTRTTRGGRGVGKQAEEQGEVSTRRGRDAGKAEAKAEAPATTRSTRSRR